MRTMPAARLRARDPDDLNGAASGGNPWGRDFFVAGLRGAEKDEFSLSSA